MDVPSDRVGVDGAAVAPPGEPRRPLSQRYWRLFAFLRDRKIGRAHV